MVVLVTNGRGGAKLAEVMALGRRCHAPGCTKMRSTQLREASNHDLGLVGV